MNTRKFFICFTIMACFCGVAPISPVQARPVKMCPVVALEGSWREIGEQTAYYFRDTIAQGAFMFSVLGVTAKKAETYYNDIEGLIPEEIKEQMQGMADGLSAVNVPALPRSKVLIWNFFMDIASRKKSGCTAFAFKSKGGDTFLAHNTDNVGLTAGMNTVIHYKPDNGDHSFLSFFGPGFVGVGMGINDQKLALSFNVGEPNYNQKTGLPVVFKAREVMTKCATLECAVEKFQDFLAEERSYGELGANLMIVDFKDSAMARIQICSDVITVTYLERPDVEDVTYGAVTNHFEGDCALPAPNGSGPFTWLSRIFRGNRKDSSHQRYERLIQLLTTPGISYDMETCWRILTDTRGTLPNDNTICRKGPLITTTASHVLTGHSCYYSLGLPSKYLKEYGKLLFIDLDDGLSRAVKPSIAGTAWRRRDESVVSSAPVALISLSEKGVRLKTYTSQDGTFVFNNLDAGTYKLRDGRKALTIWSPGKVVNYDGENIVTVDSLPVN